MVAKDMAIQVAEKYQSRNPFEIIRGMKNVTLIIIPLTDVRGFYQYFKRNCIIYVNENLPEHEKIYVCAHELGHLFLHKKANHIYMDTKTNFNTDKFEIEANKFAIELLISDEELLEYREFNIRQLSRLFGYSEQLIRLKLK